MVLHMVLWTSTVHGPVILFFINIISMSGFQGRIEVFQVQNFLSHEFYIKR